METDGQTTCRLGISLSASLWYSIAR